MTKFNVVHVRITSITHAIVIFKSAVQVIKSVDLIERDQQSFSPDEVWKASSIYSRTCQDYVYGKWVLKYYVENKALFET